MEASNGRWQDIGERQPAGEARAAAAREARGGLQWHLRERQPAVEDHAEAGRPTMGSRGAAAGSESLIVERPRAVGKELDAKEGRRQTRRVVAEES